MNHLKNQLYQACVTFVKDKETNILTTIRSNQEALNSETKSSAGDKHETGRAMLQLEMEKASRQLEIVHQMKSVLQRVEISTTAKKAKLGSLIITDSANYFLAISAGEFIFNNEKYYAISTNSPIGKLLLGKQAGENCTFRKQMNIITVY